MTTSISLTQIMLVTDFSVNARPVYSLAAGLAERFEATIQLTHFATKSPFEFSGLSNNQHLSHLRKKLEKESQRQVFANCQLTTCLLESSCVERSLAKKQIQSSSDLIITHSLTRGVHGRLDHQLVEKIVAASAVPVLLLGRAAIANGIKQPKSVLVPFDFSDKAIATFPVLRFLASQFNCSFNLRFVQLIRSHWIQKANLNAAHRFETFQQRFDDLIRMELSALDVKLEVCLGSPEYQIIDRAISMSASEKADLIVIGTHGVLGSLSKRIIYQAQCPVITVPVVSSQALTSDPVQSSTSII